MDQVNWKKRYQELAHLIDEIYKTSLSNISLVQQKIHYHVAESERLDLRERNKTKLMRLKEDVKLNVEYCNRPGPEILYPAGTLIQCGANGHVYLDDNGDGNLYFPPKLLEPVELDVDDPNVDWNKVIYQG